MRKYLNKGLLYEWFNAAKIPIFIGLITWGFVANSILKSGIVNLQNQIGYAESNGFYAVDLGDYFILGVIFLGIYIFASGVSKRNTTMFLCSGPFTKKQIKVNELICLLITLVLFIIMYLYIAITIYVRYNEFMFIVNGYPQVILIEVTRLVLFGIIGILFMLIIDLLFSNTIMAYLGMMALCISTIFFLIKFRAGYFSAYVYMMDKIFGDILHETSKHLNILFFREAYNGQDIWMIFKGIIFLMVIIGIMLFVFNISEKRAKLETLNKIFSSKINENMVIGYISLGIGTFINLIITDVIFGNMLSRTLSSEIVKMLFVDIISIGIIAFISYKIFKKVLRIIG